MSLYDDLAGLADHAAGSTDEAVGRATDSATSGDLAGVGDALAGGLDEATGEVVTGAQNGDIWYGSQDNAGVIDGLMGSVDEGMSRGPVDDAIDWSFSGHAGDTIDAAGPEASLNPGELASDVAGAAEQAAQTGNALATNWRLVGGAVGVLAAVYVLGQLFDVGVGSTA